MEDKIKDVVTPEDFGVPGEYAAGAMNYAKYMASKSAMDAERYRWLREYDVDSYLACGRLEKLDASIDAAMAGANNS